MKLNEEWTKWDFPGIPVVKNPPSNAGDIGSIPDQGTKIPHAARQLSPWATSTEKPARQNKRLHMLQLRPKAVTNKKIKNDQNEDSTKENWCGVLKSHQTC